MAASFRMIWLSSKRYPSWSTAKTCFLAEKLGTNQQNIFLKNARVDMLGCPIMMSYDASCPGTLSPDRFDLLTKTDENTSLYVKARMLSCHAPAMLIGGSGGLAGVRDARPSCGNVCVKMCQTRHEQLIFDMRNSLATHEQLMSKT